MIKKKSGSRESWTPLKYYCINKKLKISVVQFKISSKNKHIQLAFFCKWFIGCLLLLSAPSSQKNDNIQNWRHKRVNTTYETTLLLKHNVTCYCPSLVYNLQLTTLIIPGLIRHLRKLIKIRACNIMFCILPILNHNAVKSVSGE